MKKQWISVEDALPKESCEVIVVVREGLDPQKVVTAFFIQKEQAFISIERNPRFAWKHAMGDMTLYPLPAIDYWMPLPSFNLEEPSTNIKPLEWQEEGDEGFIAFGCFGTFEVFGTGYDLLPWTGSLNDANGYDGFEPLDCATLEEAKAHCQELHEKMIREALEFVEEEA